MTRKHLESSENNVIALICLATDRHKQGMIRLVVKSIREKGGFSGDIVLFSDTPDPPVRDPRLVPVHVTRFDGIPCYDTEITPPYRFPPTFFKPFMGLYHDFSRYRRLLYMDFDVLVGAPLGPVFDFMETKETLHFSYAARRCWEDAGANFLSPGFDLDKHRDSDVFRSSNTGVCAGIFGLGVTSMEKIFKPWRRRIRKLVEEGLPIGDQIPLNELLLMGTVKGKGFPHEWVDYPFTPMTPYREMRPLKSEDGFIFHHFNPGAARTKLNYMKIFTAFGNITGKG